ncbi:hypothetical protein B0H34DRAFT_807510 [Crassisporium funariophilum]|nr:hypothetical protein B0H34DRAFT_807510 [Crassisporium funariophilum]
MIESNSMAQPPTFMSNLPAEIIEKIIDDLQNDYASLKACCHIDRLFYSLCQQALFREVVFCLPEAKILPRRPKRSKPTAADNSAQLIDMSHLPESKTLPRRGKRSQPTTADNFAQLIDMSPHLADHVRTIIFRWQKSVSVLSEWAVTLADRIPPRLPYVRRIAFDLDRGMVPNWSDLPTPLQVSISRLFRSGLLCHIDLKDLREFPASALDGCKFFKQFTLPASVLTEYNKSPFAKEEPACIQVEHLIVHLSYGSLKLDQWLLSKDMKPFFDLGKLRKLTIDLMDLGGHQQLSDLLCQAASSLTELDIEPGICFHQYYKSPPTTSWSPLTATSPKLPNLQRLTIRSIIYSQSRHGHMDPHGYVVPMPWIVYFLTSILPETNSLETILLEISVRLVKVETFKTVCWAGLASILTSKSLSGLQGVDLMIWWCKSLRIADDPGIPPVDALLEDNDDLAPLIKSGKLVVHGER